nr:hypothetical protein GCM10020241_25730 [Streptoalloteichus tenebrarius]
MYVHQQRFSDDYRDALGLPLILHLAELTNEYALPHEDPERAEPEEGTSEEGTSEETADSPEQLTFDL